MKRKKSLKKIYIDVNVLYYYLTAHRTYGKKAKEFIEFYSGILATSCLTPWLLYVLTRLEQIDEILTDIGIQLLPLTQEILEKARKLSKPKDYEDRIHLATMIKNNINIIISNDSDFDKIPNITRIF